MGVLTPALAHVTMAPAESPAGETERYSMRVPTERDSPTVRIEAEFPTGLTDLELEPKQGWTFERSSSPNSAIQVVWTGGEIPPGALEQFHFTARNPAAATTLVWRVIQIHADESRAEWTGAAGTSNPAPRVEIR